MLVQEFIFAEPDCEEAAELGCGFGDRAGGCKGQDEGGEGHVIKAPLQSVQSLYPDRSPDH